MAAKHPPANNIIIAHIGGQEYKCFVTHFELIYDEFLYRKSVAWQLKFSYLISKKREKGLIAGWERKPHDNFLIEIHPYKTNKYQQHQVYKGLAKFNMVEEYKDEVPIRAEFVLDIISKSGIIKQPPQWQPRGYDLGWT